VNVESGRVDRDVEFEVDRPRSANAQHTRRCVASGLVQQRRLHGRVDDDLLGVTCGRSRTVRDAQRDVVCSRSQSCRPQLSGRRVRAVDRPGARAPGESVGLDATVARSEKRCKRIAGRESAVPRVCDKRLRHRIWSWRGVTGYRSALNEHLARQGSFDLAARDLPSADGVDGDAGRTRVRRGRDGRGDEHERRGARDD
jgi:hypothetical protein